MLAFTVVVLMAVVPPALLTLSTPRLFATPPSVVRPDPMSVRLCVLPVTAPSVKAVPSKAAFCCSVVAPV